MSDLSNWKPCATPGRVALDGTYTRLEPLNWDTHGEGLATAVAGHDSDELWHYMLMARLRACTTCGRHLMQLFVRRVGAPW
ncbi:hypothetical protein [Kordiimonas gwangyangensis]|uniref:hypothetical protein n=1 Tax=Kordiimonas gwangyangensis TaxID=288022 RepID=UPI00192E636A|nr:hypothetical protein [Kordiimonas gwangyangensis]